MRLKLLKGKSPYHLRLERRDHPKMRIPKLFIFLPSRLRSLSQTEIDEWLKREEVQAQIRAINDGKARTVCSGLCLQ